MDFSKLETAGFIVVPNFLSAIEVAALRIAHSNRYTTQLNNRDPVRVASYTVLPSYPKDRPESVTEKIQTLLNTIECQTNISATHIPPMYPTFMDNEFVKFNWHQDTDTAFKYQDLYNSLNVWIPIIKDDPNECGLHILPFDVLRKLNSKLHDRMIGHGASNGAVDNTCVWFQEDNIREPLGFELQQHSVTPTICVGDAIVLRGDVFHASQLGSTKRVAVSFRCFSSTAVVSKARFESGSAVKRQFIDGNPTYYAKMVEIFKTADTASTLSI
jgi:hypothetical protein